MTKVDTKNEIIGIAASLPYATTKKEADDGIKEIINLLNEI